MIQTKKISIIIPFFYTTERLVTLLKVIDYYHSSLDLNDFELIVVEQTKTISKLVNLKPTFKHIVIKNENQPFNIGWCYNVGLKYSNTDICMFTPCDYYIDINVIKKCIDEIHNNVYDVIIPTNKYYDTINGSNVNYELDKLDGLIDKGFNPIILNDIAKKTILFKKQYLISIGGWVEDYIGIRGTTMNMTNYLISNKTDRIILLNQSGLHISHSRIADPVMDNYNLNVDNALKTTDINLIHNHNIFYQYRGLKNKVF